jgi:NADH-quinone oxidoreductase subunit M
MTILSFFAAELAFYNFVNGALYFLFGWVVLLAGLQMDHAFLWPTLLAFFCLYATSDKFSLTPDFEHPDFAAEVPRAVKPYPLARAGFWVTVAILYILTKTLVIAFGTGEAFMEIQNTTGITTYLFEAAFISRWGFMIRSTLFHEFNLWAWDAGGEGTWYLFEIYMTFFNFTFSGLLLSVLTCFLYTIILYSSTSFYTRTSYFYFFYFSSLVALLICFLTDHFFIFYLAFEFILIPFFFIVGLWGSRVQRLGAAMRLVFFTVLFSLPLVVFIFTNFSGDLFSFRFEWLNATLMPLGYQFSALFYLAAFLAFAVKIPLFPAHVWLPEAHGEAPTFGSVLLAGILLKLGGFGFLQVCYPLSGELSIDASATMFPLVYTISVLTILYSNISVFVQNDIKKTIAYYSIGHMGFVTLGLVSGAFEGFVGAVVIMIAHGLSAAGLFFGVGYLYELSHSRALFFYRGVATIAPLFAFFFFLLICANMGLPGTLNFVGEQLVLASLVKYSPFALVLPLLGVLMNGISSILFLNRLLFGEVNQRTAQHIVDLGASNVMVYTLVAAPLIVVGFCPVLLLSILTLN